MGDVEYPLLQTCCGQSVDNEEMAEEKAGLLGRLDRLFDEYEYVVGPSVYCASFLKRQHACRTGKKIYDIILKVDEIPGIFPFKVSVHNCCHGTSEEHSFFDNTYYSKVNALLSLVEGIELVEPTVENRDCGKKGSLEDVLQNPACLEIDNLKRHIATGSDFITGPDCSCLMHMQHIANEEKLDASFIHVIQILTAEL
jgi:L-lactate dehydrogenase complex protein LldE